MSDTNKKQTGWRISEELRLELKILAIKNGMKLEDYVSIILSEHVNNLKNK